MRTSLIVGLFLAVGLTAGQVLSKDDPGRPAEDMIKAMEKNATPGPEHARLKALVGSFETHVKAVADPSQPAKETVGRSEKKAIFDGLFVEEEFHGQCPFTGKTLHGIGYVGYDNAKKKYVSVWLSSLGSGIALDEGTADGAGKVLTFTGTCTDPATGAEKKIRAVLTIVDDKKHTLEMFQPGPDGKEIRGLEITYLRK